MTELGDLLQSSWNALGTGLKHLPHEVAESALTAGYAGIFCAADMANGINPIPSLPLYVVTGKVLATFSLDPVFPSLVALKDEGVGAFFKTYYNYLANVVKSPLPLALDLIEAGGLYFWEKSFTNIWAGMDPVTDSKFIMSFIGRSFTRNLIFEGVEIGAKVIGAPALYLFNKYFVDPMLKEKPSYKVTPRD